MNDFKKLMKKLRPNILSIYEGDMEIEIKEDKSPLTLADKYVHKEIESFLKENYPYPILSEEGKDIEYSERKNWKKFWLVDPIDGTKEFIKKNGEFTVNIALIENGKPVFGAIYIPVKDILYYGDKKGSFKVEDLSTGEKSTMLPDRNIKKTDKIKIVASRSHISEETKQFIESIEGEKEIISVGSSIKLCLVAEGIADIYPRFSPTMEWDIAAGHAIVNGANKRVIEEGKDTEIVYNKENLLNPNFKAM